MRHLIFHITPRETHGEEACWKWHLRQLNHYAHLFDGQLLFAIVSGPGLLPADKIAPYLPPRSQIISLPNHAEYREAYTLPMLLAKAFTIDPQDTVFFAHTKGMQWIGKGFESTTRWWSLAMYRWLFSKAALDLLTRFPVVGWLKYEGTVRTFPPSSKWHYAGTFWWFRAREIYLRPWWFVTPAIFGAEAYLSAFFESQHAPSLYTIKPDQFFAIGGDACTYRPEFWNQIGIPTGPDAESYDGSPL